MTPELQISETARKAMGAGHNCCESVLLAADEFWVLNLPDEVLASAALFLEGMGSGCSCGALVGLMMVSGILSQRYPHPLGQELAPHLYQRFKEEFGSSCCRVICSKRTPLERIGKRGCKALTGTAAAMLVATWGGVINGKK